MTKNKYVTFPSLQNVFTEVDVTLITNISDSALNVQKRSPINLLPNELSAQFVSALHRFCKTLIYLLEPYKCDNWYWNWYRCFPFQDPLTDPGVTNHACPHLVSIFSNFIQFLGKICQNNRLASSHLRLAPHMKNPESSGIFWIHQVTIIKLQLEKPELNNFRGRNKKHRN